MRATILQHLWCESSGLFGEMLESRGFSLDIRALDEGAVLPSLEETDLVLALGGPMSVNEEDVWSFLAPEKHFIADVVERQIPYFGVCLGAQLLASAAGASVMTGPAPEVGVLTVRRTQGVSDVLFDGLSEEFAVLQWHGDTFELPHNSTLLASSTQYAHQAFRVGTCAYGVQFHLEVTDDMVVQWSQIPEYVASLRSARGDGGFRILQQEVADYATEMRESAEEIFGRFLDHIVLKKQVGVTSAS